MNEPEVNRRILDAATIQFVKYGYVKVTTGEIAGAAGVSKKTLYKLFRSKEELFRATALRHLAEVREKFDALTRNKNLSLIDRLCASMEVLAEKLLEIGDFLKVRPGTSGRVFDEIMNLRRDIVVGFYRKLFREGVKSGSINRRVNETAFILMLITVMQSLFVPEVLAGLPISHLELFKSAAYTLLEGVLSEKGRQLLASKPISFGRGAEGYWNA